MRKTLIVLLVLAAPAGSRAGEPAAAARAGGTALEPAALLGAELELVRRVEGKVQRGVLDRLLGAGKAEALVERLPSAPADAVGKALGAVAPAARPKAACGIRLKEAFSEERLALVRAEALEVLAQAGYDGAVAFLAPDPAAERIEAARTAIYAGDLAQALALADEVLAEDAGSVPALELAGSVRFLMGDKAGARLLWGRALELDPENPAVRSALGRI